ncbi:MAG: PhoH family protein [candidate division Zixibacteria bacterium]|nr:PhoH family protein [candidate division Zixibacteria bacterium]MDH3938656.1 PhoH family protein [candidate division Zixibacteria bacterium]MDH4032830.1 PhoH family protein [candidate division Zixibacteria bacterium]
MELAEKKSLSILLEGVDQRLLFGQNDISLRIIESSFVARMIARGDRLTIEGAPSDVDQVARLVDDLVTRVRQGDVITEQYLHYAISMVKENGFGPASEISTENLLTSALKKAIKPKTVGQSRYVEAVDQHDLVFSIGPAGTGKTYLAVAMAVAELKANRVKRLVFTRPAVEAGESLGFLPGDLRAKVDPYLRPVYDALYDMLQPDKIRKLLDLGVIEIAPLAFMRGRTLNEAFVVLDEAQNTTSAQMKMFLTRIGEDSKAIITGDITQIDLDRPQNSGLVKVQKILKGIDGISFVYLSDKDVVRHRLVQRIIKAYERFEKPRRKE